MKNFWIIIAGVTFCACMTKKSVLDTSLSIESEEKGIKEVLTKGISLEEINTSSSIFITEKVTEKDTLGRVMRTTDRKYDIRTIQNSTAKDSFTVSYTEKNEKKIDTKSTVHSSEKHSPNYTAWITTSILTVILCGALWWIIKKKLFF